MLVDRLTRDEELHDLRGTLEDAGDAQISEDLLGWDRRLATRPQ
jgi:hypothetical protein